MNPTPPILSIDCGTQSIRAILFSQDGDLLDKVQIEYEPYYSDYPGWAEQDPDVYWQNLCHACQTLKDRNESLFGQIKGVGITAIRASMVNMDRDGNTLRPVIVWLDQRKARPSFIPNPFVDFLLRTIGIRDTIMKNQTSGKGNWIMQNQPDVWKNTHKYVQVSGFLNHRLTGMFKDSIASQIGHVPFSYKKMAWASKWDPISFLFPLDRDKMPELVMPGEIIGHVTADASKKTGIPEGIPVIACGSDKGCETIGMGVINPGMASLSFGTTATVQTTTARYFEPLRFLPPYPAAIPGHYNPEIEIFRGYWMITWFKNEFAHQEVEEAAKQGIKAEVVLNQLLKEAPPGSMGLLVQPYWGPGLNVPEAKGAMIGFGDVHKKAHVFRGVIEGLAYGLLEGLTTMEKRGRMNVTKIAVSGGASQSDEICQITADIFNRPLVRGKTFETSGLGAAIVTARGIGLYDDFYQAIQKMVHYDTVFHPNPDHTEIYHKLYHRVYRKMYQALKPLYEEIREITGYPEK
ncbi:MAG: FGGY-family carbohydrate kinase [Proteobacteria bacterium]|nr:FGGY-family carbohydrate kinase [Pseudomonadota bacterium]